MIVNPFCEIRIAREAITCRKVIIMHSRAMWRSIFREAVYEYNKILDIGKNLKIDNPPRFQLPKDVISPGIIDPGFHAYINLDEDAIMKKPEIENISWSYLVFEKIAHLSQIIVRTCIIPKGAEYCLGRDNEIVSNKLYIPDTDRVDYIDFKLDEEMCLIVEKDHKIEIAEEDIPVFKLINKSKESENTWIAPLFRTEHEFNKELEACEHLELIFKEWAGEKGGNTILQGFHAYQENKEGVILNYAIIPKGAEYCYGINNEIVSNRIIVFSSKEEYECFSSSKSKDVK